MLQLLAQVKKVIFVDFFLIILNIAYICTELQEPGLFMPYNTEKLLRTAASKLDMSPFINNTSDFFEHIVVDVCKKNVLLNVLECEARIDHIRMWNVRFH